MEIKTGSKKIFALPLFFDYPHSASAKSDAGIHTLRFDKRQSNALSMAGLLRAASAGRFFCRGSVNPLQSAANIGFTPDGGSNKPKTKDQVMNTSSRLFTLPLPKRRYFLNNLLVVGVVNYALGFFIRFLKTESFIDNFSAINFVLPGENNVASKP